VFAETMAAAFGRRVVLRVPGWLLRFALGEMAELLVCGQRAIPAAARSAGYTFRHPILAQAAADLARPAGPTGPAASARPWSA
jgi:hypothetical protein